MIYEDERTIYTGHFLNDQKHGMGSLTDKDGNTYEGELVYGLE